MGGGRANINGRLHPADPAVSNQSDNNSNLVCSARRADCDLSYTTNLHIPNYQHLIPNRE